MARSVLGIDGFKPWQRYAAARITEHRNGVLRWPVAVVTVGRQQGKSLLLASLIAWRILRGPELFGEPQQVLSMAQKVGVASLVFRQVADRLDEAGVAEHVNRAPGKEQAHGDGWYWRVIAARLNSTTGYSTSLAVVDEAWNIDRDVVVSGVRPQSIQRAQPQLVLSSTAGDGRSDLLQYYRSLGMRPKSPVLLLEWSAPAEADPDDENAWRWSLPDWQPKVYRELRSETDELSWRRQYLNQWVIARDGWVSPNEWARCRTATPMPDGGHVVAGPSRDHTAWWAVRAVQDGGVARVVTFRSTSARDAWTWVNNQPGDVRVWLSAGVRHRDPDWLRPVAGVVGARELHASVRLVQAMIRDKRLAHDGDEQLAEHVLRAKAHDTPGGTTYLRAVGGPVDLCEGMVLAVDQATRRQAAAPTVVVAS